MRRRDGGRQRARERYPSLAAFYNADERRISSRELDVGLWWRENLDGPLHRAAWVEETGELYLVRLGPLEKGGGVVELLASADSSESLEAVLEGWRDQCGGPRSLAWLRERAARQRERLQVGRRQLAAGGAGPALLA